MSLPGRGSRAAGRRSDSTPRHRSPVASTTAGYLVGAVALAAGDGLPEYPQAYTILQKNLYQIALSDAGWAWHLAGRPSPTVDATYPVGVVVGRQSSTEADRPFVFMFGSDDDNP